MVLLKFADGSKHNILLKELENIPFFNIFPNITDKIEIDLGYYNKNFTYKNLMKCIGFSEKLDDSCIDLMDFLGQDFKYYDQDIFNRAFIGDISKLIEEKDYIPLILRCQIDEEYWIEHFKEMVGLPFNIFKKCITESNVNIENRNDDTGLILACEMCGREIVDFLISKGGNITVEDKDGNTLLMVAVDNNNKEIVEYFINNGADVNTVNEHGETALVLAYQNKNFIIMELLIKAGADVDFKLTNNKTLLTIASKYGNFQGIKFLINAGANVNHHSEYYTPLLEATINGHKNVIELLINAGADVNAKSKFGDTALILASDYGKRDIVKVLIKAGANLTIKNNGMTALSLASRNKHNETAKLLREARDK